MILRRKAEQKWRLTRSELDLNELKSNKNYTDFVEENSQDQKKFF